MLIRGLIRKDVESIGPYEGTHKIKNKLSCNTALAVMEHGQYLGLLSADDLVINPHNIVIDCLTDKPQIQPTHTIVQALNEMRQGRNHVLPVFEDGKFQGTISYADIIGHLSAVIDDQKNSIQAVAHDLKNPILTILGIVSLLKNNGHEETDELAGITEQACNYAMEMIQDLLQTPQSTDEEDDEVIHFELTEVNSFLKECVSGVHSLAHSKKIDIQDSMSNEKVYSLIHKTKLKRAFHNILSNAIKFTPANGNIQVSMSHNIDTVIIKIKDSGIGIPESTQPHIFTKFSKAKRAGTAGEQSNGLGLFITKQIVEAHKGHVWFESNTKTGTTFFISLNKEAVAPPAVSISPSPLKSALVKN